MNRWTIFFYICYDNELSIYLINDLKKLCKPKYTGKKVTYHFLISTRKGTIHSRIKDEINLEKIIYKNKDATVFQSSNTLDMSDPYILENFLKIGKTLDPARKYAFFYNGGSTGSSLNVGKNYFLIKDFVKCVKNVNMHFDILAFDSCLMATIETAYECRKITDYIIASEQYEGGVGLNSEILIKEFWKKDFNIKNICISISNEYIKQVNNKKLLQKGDTINDYRDSSVISTSHINQLVNFINKYCEINIKKSYLIDPIFSNETYYADLFSSCKLIDSKNKHMFNKIFKDVVIHYKQNEGMKRLKNSLKYNGLSFLFDKKILNYY